MSLKERIKTDFMLAMRTKEMEKKTILGVVLGEVQTEEGRGVLATDEMVLNVVRKMEKSMLQTNTAESLGEIEFIKPYLPTLMSEEEIRVILGGYKSTGLNNVGALMGAFNKDHKGLADNKLVSGIVKEILL